MSSITPVPAPTERDRATTVLVLGGDGFIAGYLIAALRRRGWRVLRGVRMHGARTLRDDERVCDFTTMTAPEHWRDALDGVDAVVNAAGILRETGRQTFDAIHVDGPLALARACVDAGVRRFVQISALGLPADGAFIASKHHFDETLAALPLSAVALRPSVVYSATGSYGGTSMLRALAALPFAHALPGDGRWPIQPIAAEDLGELVARAVDNDVRGIHEVGGPEIMSLRDYQNAWRAWLRIPGTRAIERALYASHEQGLRRTGVMVHFVPDEGVDDGPVIAMAEVPILADDTLESLTARVHATERTLLVSALRTIVGTA